jgi:hypothetical protein
MRIMLIYAILKDSSADRQGALAKNVAKLKLRRQKNID